MLNIQSTTVVVLEAVVNQRPLCLVSDNIDIIVTSNACRLMF